jgi:aspartate carbamoyltransferase regulatory subunit
MRKKSVYRGILIIAGLMAAAVIILSHSLTELKPKQVADTEQSDEKPDQKTVITAPAEAVTQASVVKIDEQSPDTVLETLSNSEISNKYIPSSEKVFNKLFHVLFQIVIAPNAP